MKKFLAGAFVGLYLFPSSLCAVEVTLFNSMDNEIWEDDGKRYTKIHLVIDYENNQEKGKKELNLPSARSKTSIDIGESPETLHFRKITLELLGTPENSAEPQSLWTYSDTHCCLKQVIIGLERNPFFGVKKGEEQYRRTCIVF